jgi:hypothetical protein
MLVEGPLQQLVVKIVYIRWLCIVLAMPSNRGHCLPEQVEANFYSRVLILFDLMDLSTHSWIV